MIVIRQVQSRDFLYFLHAQNHGIPVIIQNLSGLCQVSHLTIIGEQRQIIIRMILQVIEEKRSYGVFHVAAEEFYI